MDFPNVVTGVPFAVMFVAFNVLVLVLNVKFADPANTPLELIWICVFDPAAVAVLIAGPNVITSIGAVFGGAVVNVNVVPLTL